MYLCSLPAKRLGLPGEGGMLRCPGRTQNGAQGMARSPVPQEGLHRSKG